MTNWDNEIDDVAREMAGTEPDAGLKARVLARIEANEAPWWSRRSVWAWSPVAVAATAVLALLIVGATWTSDNAAGTKVRHKPDPTYHTVRLKPDPKDDEVRLKPDPTATSVRLKPDPTYSYVGSAFRRTETGPVNDALVQAGDLAPPPIEIEPIGVEVMEAMETIQVQRLAVAQLEVPTIGDE
jgi:hypothetical protein